MAITVSVCKGTVAPTVKLKSMSVLQVHVCMVPVRYSYHLQLLSFFSYYCKDNIFII